ncbi:MAG TPA: PfkB family carbohydrate kinase [Solirubrobacteraceae bacterium]|nr:PfkB family carbohydrate kinase [Solirubrobacteraceae bacterium]
MPDSRAHLPVTVFGPDPLLSVTIEASGAVDQVHVHPAGQGVWVARMAGELGAWPILCGFLGGETGAALLPLLEALPGERRVVRTAGFSGSYVVDRRTGKRRVLANGARPAPQRHEIDDLVATTYAAALTSEVLVLCNPFPGEGLPAEVYETLAADVRAAAVPVIVDLSTPRLDRVLAHRPDLVKLNDWELAEYVRGPVDGHRAVDGARRLLAAGAGAVAVTRADAPILVLAGDDESFEIVPPVLPWGFREGCGDAMMGAITAGWARGLALRDSLVLGAAAGSANFLRHGLGTGSRTVVERLAERVVVRPMPLGSRAAGYAPADPNGLTTS